MGATTGLTYKVWTSTDMAGWSVDTGAQQTPGAAHDGVRTVAVTLSSGLLAAPQLFVRVIAE
jgi:hypothetical protein